MTETGKRSCFFLAGLSLAAFAVRLYQLGKANLWMDEIIFVNILSNPALGPFEIFMQYWNYSTVAMAQLPFAGVVQNIWIHLAGGGDVVKDAFLMRVPAVVFGGLAVPVFYAAVKQTSNRISAAVSALFMAFLFFPVYYSREAYCYAPLIFFSTCLMYFFAKTAFSERPAPYLFFLLFLSAWFVLWSHFAGLFLVFAYGLCSLVLIVVSRIKRGRRDLLKARILTAVGLLLSSIPVLPFLYKSLAGGMTHLQTESPYSLLLILNDGLNKFLLGERPIAVVIVWALLALGGWQMLRGNEDKEKNRCFFAIGVIAYIMTAVAAKNSQYLSARYFSACLPVYYLVITRGLARVAAGIESLPFLRSGRKGFVLPLLCVLLIGFSFISFILPLYRLSNKSSDFKVIAEWLNENLPPGTPYVLESGYNSRFIPGFYPTPLLVGANPYVHGSGPEEMQRLHERQSAFIRRFPVSAFVECSHHSWNTPEGVWKWPGSFYKQHVVLANPELDLLCRRGINPWEPYRELSRYDWTTDLFYNTEEDAITIAREQGEDVYFDFKDWQCRPVAAHPGGMWTEYARVHDGARASVNIINLQDTVVTGRVVMRCAAAGYEGSRFNLTYLVNGKLYGTSEIQAGKFQNIVSEPLIIDAGARCELILHAQAPGINNPKALIIHDAEFLTE